VIIWPISGCLCGWLVGCVSLNSDGRKTYLVVLVVGVAC
jgi:hypothetical protein